MKAKKYLGQNFLIDKNVIGKTIANILATENDLIIEIGPGKGALTKELKKKRAYLLAYEVDIDLKSDLEKIEDDKTRIIWHDFLESNIKEDIKNIRYNNLYIVGNLPYYITTPIIEHIIDANLDFVSLTIMVQKEVAQRFNALVHTKEYGYITVLLKHYFDIVYVTDVSKEAFRPVPKVESAVISFVPKKNRKEIDIDKYKIFLKRCFSNKRKTLKNNLGVNDYTKIKNILEKNNYSDNVRAEEITDELFIELFEILY